MVTYLFIISGGLPGTCISVFQYFYSSWHCGGYLFIYPFLAACPEHIFPSFSYFQYFWHRGCYWFIYISWWHLLNLYFLYFDHFGVILCTSSYKICSVAPPWFLESLFSPSLNTVPIRNLDFDDVAKRRQHSLAHIAFLIFIATYRDTSSGAVLIFLMNAIRIVFKNQLERFKVIIKCIFNFPETYLCTLWNLQQPDGQGCAFAQKGTPHKRNFLYVCKWSTTLQIPMRGLLKTHCFYIFNSILGKQLEPINFPQVV